MSQMINTSRQKIPFPAGHTPQVSLRDRPLFLPHGRLAEGSGPASERITEPKRRARDISRVARARMLDALSASGAAFPRSAPLGNRARLLAVSVVSVVVCCAAAAWLGSPAAAPAAALQEGIFTPGIQETLVAQPQRGGAGARRQSLLAGYAAMGTVGGGEHGLHNVPPPPPPTWARGGHSWVYDKEYGTGVRPTTGIWASMKADAEGPPSPSDGGVEEEDEVPTEEPSEPAAAEEEQEDEGAPAEEPAEEQSAEEPAAEEAAQEEEEPAGEQEEAPVPEPAAAEEPEGGAEQGCDDEENCGQQGVVVNVPGGGTQYVTQQVPVPVPAAASQQLPMEWAAEDAAEHAYNLAQWRVKILRAKMEQAKLRKQLMAVTMGATPDVEEGPSEDASVRASPGSRGRRGELLAVKKSLLSLAQETVGAIKQLKGQMLSLKKAVRGGNKDKAPEMSLAQVQNQDSAVQRAIARVKAQKAQEVLAMKKKMDAQLNSLLSKVAKLVQHRRHTE